MIHECKDCGRPYETQTNPECPRCGSTESEEVTSPEGMTTWEYIFAKLFGCKGVDHG